jgi:3-oxoacyl-(acyl-carrier-protein) synthase
MMQTTPRAQAHIARGIAITGLGMVTPIGLNVVSSCAAARAELSRRSELTIEEADVDTLESVPLRGHVVQGITNGFDGFARLLRLGDLALEDLLKHSGLKSEHLSKTGLVLNLPGHFYEAAHLRASLSEAPPEDEAEAAEREQLLAEAHQIRERLNQRIPRELLALHSLTIPPQVQACFTGGAAAFIRGLAQAVHWLQTRAVDRCILGGIDSFVHGEPLTQVHELGLTRGVENVTGFFPGEASAFVLLERTEAARARGAATLGLLGPYAAAREAQHRFSSPPPLGAALFEAMAACLAPRNPQPRDEGLLIVNINGDTVRARDFGTALVRLADAKLSSTFRQWYPPEHFGEIGAATGAASLCMGIRGFARNYAGTQDILVALLDDEQDRGAFVLESPLSPPPQGVP